MNRSNVTDDVKERLYASLIRRVLTSMEWMTTKKNWKKTQPLRASKTVYVFGESNYNDRERERNQRTNCRIKVSQMRIKSANDPFTHV